MGHVYYDMGFLSSAEVLECSASDLVGQYVGHTGPKTVAQLDKALGKILFIDEAYRLSEGQFATEATNELVDQLTKPKYLNKIVVILAGYDKDINKLISINPGLSSRFPEEINFETMTPQRCVELLMKKLGQKHITIPTLDDIHSSAYRSMCDLFKQLAALPSFGNGREVETLAKTMSGFVYRQPITGGTLILTEDDALRLTKTMLHQRQDRSANMPNTSVEILPRAKTAAADSRPPWASGAPSTTAKDPKLDAKSTDNKSADSQPSAPKDQPPSDSDPLRDPEVSDEVWNQLQLDKQALKAMEQQEATDLRRREEALAEAQALEAEKARALQELAKQQAKEEAERALTLQNLAKQQAKDEAAKALALQEQAKQQAKDEAERQERKRRHEQARLAEQQARLQREKALLELERARIQQARRKEQEVQAQKKLREMGVCVAGYRWIKQASGYRCEAGGHFVSDAQLGL